MAEKKVTEVKEEKKAPSTTVAPKVAETKVETKNMETKTEETVPKTEFDRLMGLVADMQKQMQSQPKNKGVSDVNPMFDRTNVISYMMGKNNVPLSGGREISFLNYGQSVSLTINDVSDMLNRSVSRQLFVDGLLGFDDDKWYDYYGLRSAVVLTDENILEILRKDDEGTVKGINQLTNNMKNETVVWHLLYRIAWLYKENKINGVDSGKLMCLNEHFFGKLPERFSMSMAKAQRYLDWLE